MNSQKYFFLIILLLFSLILASPLKAEELKTIYPEADTFVDNAYPQDNFGKSDVLEMAFSDSSKIIFLKFNLEGLNEDLLTDNKKAVLHLKQEEFINENPLEFEILLPQDTWEEETLTWDNKPSLFPGNLVIGLTSAKGEEKIDLTPLYLSWIRGEIENRGLTLYYNGHNFSKVFKSRESEKDKPFLAFEQFTPVPLPTPKPSPSPSPEPELVSPSPSIEPETPAILVQKPVPSPSIFKPKTSGWLDFSFYKESFKLENLLSANNALALMAIWTAVVFLCLLKFAKPS